MHIYLNFLLIALVLLNPWQNALGGTREVCQVAEAALKQASQIRGLAIKKKVPCEVHGKELVKEYIVGTIKTKLPPQRLEHEEWVYKALGMIPESFDYTKGIVDLYLSQIGGYYDPEKKHFIMAGWLPAALQTTIAAHELTHALQDQYFRLDSFMDIRKYSSDQMLARSALVEGDASAVMYDFVRRGAGQPPLSQEADVGSILVQNVLGSQMVAGMTSIPSSIQVMLIFPYTSGLRFAHHLLRTGGYVKIDAAFSHPPRSTEEILHPEKFGANQDFREITPEEVVSIGTQPERIAFSDVLGEFGISALLGMGELSRDESTRAAEGWGGDRVVLLEKKASAGDPEYEVRWLSSWDSSKDADEFELAIRKFFLFRGGKKVAAEGNMPLGDAYVGQIERDGVQVRIRVRSKK
jgi:hypothetical protein